MTNHFTSSGKETHPENRCLECGAAPGTEAWLKECRPPESDPTNPAHYKNKKIEHWDVVKAWGLDYLLGCSTKYMSRHMDKGTPLVDIDKAITYALKYRQELAQKLGCKDAIKIKPELLAPPIS